MPNKTGEGLYISPNKKIGDLCYETYNLKYVPKTTEPMTGRRCFPMSQWVCRKTSGRHCSVRIWAGLICQLLKLRIIRPVLR